MATITNATLAEERVRESLQKLVRLRDEEIQTEFKSRREELSKLETRGQELIKKVKADFPELAKMLAQLEELHKINDKDREKELEKQKERLKSIAQQPPNESPSFAQGLTYRSQYGPISNLPPIITAVELAPYYTKIQYSDGRTPYEDYYSGRVDVSCWAKGKGTGYSGAGFPDPEGQFHIYVDRWFFFRPDLTRSYTFNIHEPYHGFYKVEAHDGDFTSKEALAVIISRRQVYQNNWKGIHENNWFHLGGKNIDRADRLDQTRRFSQEELLVGDELAFLLVTQSLNVFARGQYSYSELNFATDSGNYLPAPALYIT
jgi:hypothetical protein